MALSKDGQVIYSRGGKAGSRTEADMGGRCVGGLLCFSSDFLRIVSHSYKERAGSTSGCED